MKTRRHHNNDGRRMIKTGSHVRRLKRLAHLLGIPFGPPPRQKGSPR